jgi:hypothetical protein
LGNPRGRDPALLLVHAHGLSSLGGEGGWARLARADQEQRLREQWAEVLAGVSICRELEVLVLPTSVKVEPSFPFDAAFGRLTHLEMADPKRKRSPGAGAMGLWELMASGGLPALATLKVVLKGRRLGGPKKLKNRIAQALEAVAGTLTHLNLRKSPGLQSGDVDIGHELGVAVGKLRQLTDLTLDLSEDGRVYHAVAQGLAASVGDRPLPLLRRVVVHSEVGLYADRLASLVLPSVQVFASSHEKLRAALLMANALRQAGYKRVWAVDCPDEFKIGVQAIAECGVGDWRLYD